MKCHHRNTPTWARRRHIKEEEKTKREADMLCTHNGLRRALDAHLSGFARRSESNIDKLSLATIGTPPVSPLSSTPTIAVTFMARVHTYVRMSGCLDKGRGVECLFDFAFHHRLGNPLSSPRRRGKWPRLYVNGTGLDLMNVVRCIPRHVPWRTSVNYIAQQL